MLLKVLTLFVVISFANIQRSESLTCPTCTTEHKATACDPLPECLNGVTTDMCGCCEVCYKGENEECGGIWNHGGSCADQFECVPSTIHEQRPGTCLRKAGP